jgi:hypothetical protein
MQIEGSISPSVLFDPELPTAKEVMGAICCVATRYALNPSFELAKTASILALKLTAPEYAESALITEIAKRLVSQWEDVLCEQAYVETQIMPSHHTLQ